jgi:hypothetical protein
MNRGFFILSIGLVGLCTRQTAYGDVIFQGTVTSVSGDAPVAVGTTVAAHILGRNFLSITELRNKSFGEPWSFSGSWISLAGAYVGTAYPYSIQASWPSGSSFSPGGSLMIDAETESRHLFSIEVGSFLQSFEGNKNEVFVKILKGNHPELPLQAYTQTGDDGKVFMKSEFAPHVINSVYLAAQVLGYDHFNWYQEITHFYKDGREVTGEEIEELFDRGKGPDPLPGWPRKHLGPIPLDPADDLPWYWDEEGTSEDFRLEKNIANWPRILEFGDPPNLLDAGLACDFSTYLAIVSEDGRRGNVLGEGFNVAFNWRFTQTTDTEGEYQIFGGQGEGAWGTIELLGYLQPEDWTPERIARLNAAGVEVLGIPEPSTLALLGAGACALALGWWRRRRTA